MIPNISKRVEPNRLCDGLNPTASLEALKTSTKKLETLTKILVNI